MGAILEIRKKNHAWEIFTSEIPRFRDCSPRGNKSKLPWAGDGGYAVGHFLQEPRNHSASGAGGRGGLGDVASRIPSFEVPWISPVREVSADDSPTPQPAGTAGCCEGEEVCV